MYAAITAFGTSLPSGVDRIIGHVTKDERNPLFVQDTPWEPRIDNGYPNVAYDPTAENGTYQMWYGDCVRGCGTQILLYANSSDGLSWTKPDLGLFDVGLVRKDLAHIGKHNNIILKGGGIGVYKDMHDGNASRRYKAFGVGCFSPTGNTGTYSLQ